jgi:cysteine desulfurase
MTDSFCYLDYNASTPIHPEVLESYYQTAQKYFANPSSSHRLGKQAQELLQQAREQMAVVLDCEPQEIWFTSGGTESNNWILERMALRFPKKHFIVAGIEHKSVLQSARFLEAQGQIELTVLPVALHGALELSALQKALRPETVFVSLMLANNETGIIQPVQELASLCHKRGILLHTDAVAALGKIPLSFRSLGVEALSLSAHKLYSPKAVGLLVLKESSPLEPLIHGCGQQQGMRSGTENLAGVVAFAKAFDLLKQGAFREKEITQHTQTLQKELTQHFSIVFHGSGERLPNTLSVAFPGYSGQKLLQALSEKNIFVSAGAAASTGAPSSVLTAMGVDTTLAQSTLRLSLGWGNTSKMVEYFLEHLHLILSCSEVQHV